MFNFSKEKLPFIKECIFVNNQICKDYTNGILTFDKVYSSKSNIIEFNYLYLYNINNLLSIINNREVVKKYMSLFYKNINNEITISEEDKIKQLNLLVDNIIELSEEDKVKYLKIFEDINYSIPKRTLEYQFE